MSFELVAVNSSPNDKIPDAELTGNAMRVARDYIHTYLPNQFETSFTFEVNVSKRNDAYTVRLYSNFDIDDENVDVCMFKIKPCIYRRFAEKFITKCQDLFNKNARFLKINSLYQGLDTLVWNGQYRFETIDDPTFSEVLVNKWLLLLRNNVRDAQQSHIRIKEEQPQIVFNMIAENELGIEKKKMYETNDGVWAGTSDKQKKFENCTLLKEGDYKPNRVLITNCWRMEDWPDHMEKQRNFFDALSEDD